MLYFTANCKHTIRTLPALQHDESRIEDVDTDGEDHAADETRYACMSRPWMPAEPQKPENKERYKSVTDDEEPRQWRVA